jgi:hypothetical protein
MKLRIWSRAIQAVYLMEGQIILGMLERYVPLAIVKSTTGNKEWQRMLSYKHSYKKLKTPHKAASAF